MKMKKLLVALPLVAAFASCSARIETYSDIFKKARHPSDGDKEIAQAVYQTTYVFNGTKTSRLLEHAIPVGEPVIKNISVEVENDEEAQYKRVRYQLGEDVLVNIHYDADVGDFIVDALPNGLYADSVFRNYRDLVYDWNAHVKTGVFDNAPYEFDARLLDAVSRKSQVVAGSVESGNFEVKLSSKATYTDGENTYGVSTFDVTYANHLIVDYECTYDLYIASFGITYESHVTGLFDYEGH